MSIYDQTKPFFSYQTFPLIFIMSIIFDQTKPFHVDLHTLHKEY